MVQPVGQTWHYSGSRMALSYCGNKGVLLVCQARYGPDTRGIVWASPAVDYLGPGQSSVKPHQGDNGVAGFPGYFKPSGQ